MHRRAAFLLAFSALSAESLALPRPVAAAPLPSSQERNLRAGFVAGSSQAAAAYKRQADQKLISLREEIVSAENRIAQLERENRSLQQTAGRESDRLQGEIDKLSSEKADLELQWTERLAEKDEQFARDLQMLLRVSDDLTSTPEGREALARYNAGGPGSYEAANLVLHKLAAERQASRERMLAAQAEQDRLDQAADLRQIATLGYDALGKGRSTTDVAIAQYEAVVNLAGEYGDWITLAELYRNGNYLDRALAAAQQAEGMADTDARHVDALVAQSDAYFLQALNVEGLRNFEAGSEQLVTAIRENAARKNEPKPGAEVDSLTGLDATLGQFGSMLSGLGKMVALFEMPPEIALASEKLAEAERFVSSDGTRANRLALAVIALRQGEVLQLQQNADLAIFAQSKMEEVKEFVTTVIPQAMQAKQEGEEAYKRFEAAAGLRMKAVMGGMEDWQETQTGASKAAEEKFRAAHTIYSALLAQEPDSLPLMRGIAACEEELAESLKVLDRKDEAEDWLTSAQERRLALRQFDPSSTLLKMELGFNHLQLGELYPKESSEAKIEQFLQAYHLAEELLQADPNSALNWRLMGKAKAMLAGAKAEGFAWEDVVAHYEDMRGRELLAPVDEQALAVAKLSRLTN